jgi:phospholipid/cholesterol/gamma-HCH transport system ATP-binding protein
MAAALCEPAPLIEVKNLVKRYDDNVVLDGFGLRVDRGETCVIIGRSGVGKSTFARLLVGLERPDSGEIWIDGTNIVGLGARGLDRVRRKFAVVYQKYALLDSMSVFDNVAFPLREETDLSNAEIAKRVHRALRELEVDDAALKLPGELSGGMSKRVGTARAVITDPEILVYDEPTTGLDPISSRIVDGLIERMRTGHGVTSVVITHDMVTAYGIADWVALLADGKTVAQGTPEELFRSHGKDIEPFAKASGVDVANFASRAGRESPARVRAKWSEAHPASAEESRDSP